MVSRHRNYAVVASGSALVVAPGIQFYRVTKRNAVCATVGRIKFWLADYSGAVELNSVCRLELNAAGQLLAYYILRIEFFCVKTVSWPVGQN